jgi:DNA-binding NarL/FixJ family response regulator
MSGVSETPKPPGRKMPGRSSLRLVVVTFSSCPEYLQDLWDLQPDILIVDTKHGYDLSAAVIGAAKGEQYRLVPPGKTSLTSNERIVLRYVARGWSNKQIAEMLHIHEKTIINTLTAMYRKLGVKSRAEAILYYWDVWYAHSKANRK